MRVGDRGECVERVTFDNEVRTGQYQWDALRRAVCGERIEGETQPEEIAAGVAIISAMARADASHREEAVAVPTRIDEPTVPQARPAKTPAPYAIPTARPTAAGHTSLR